MNPLSGRGVRLISLTLSLILAQGMTSCASPSQPSRFYRLDSQLPPAVMPERQRDGAPIPLVGIGPVNLASYLDRPQLIERSSGYRLDLYEFDRWAGTLQENIVQVLTNVMQQALPQAQVVGQPWDGSMRPDYQVLLYVSRFDRQGDKVRLWARWSLVDDKSDRLIWLDQSEIEVSVEGADLEAGVAASSEALQLLAREISLRLLPLLAAQR